MPHDVHGHARAVRVRLLVAAAVDHGARVAEQDAVGGEHAVQVAHLHGDVVGIVDADGDADAEPDGDVDAEHVLFYDDHADDFADTDAVKHDNVFLDAVELAYQLANTHDHVDANSHVVFHRFTV